MFKRKKTIYLGTGILLVILLILLAGYGRNEVKQTETTNSKTEDQRPTNQKQTEQKQPEQKLEATETAPATDSAVTKDTTEDKESVEILMVGDVLLHTPVSESGRQPDGSYCYDSLFANVKDDTESADIAIVNQEVILGGEELGVSGYPCFNGRYEVGDAICNAGFDVVLHGTNHSLDKGKQGILNCLAYWRTNHSEMAVLGIHDTPAAKDAGPYFVEKNGIRIAILNYSFGTNGIAPPEDMPYAVDYLDKKAVAEDIALAEKEADFTVVCPHWGTEYRHDISAMQEEYCSLFLESGVDLVIGTHPHVIEPVKWLEAEDGDRMLVYYSLGNFVNATSGTGEGVADRMLGEMAKVKIERGQNGEITITAWEAIPIVSHLETTAPGMITTYKLSDYSEYLANKNEIIAQDDDFSYNYCMELWKEYGMDAQTGNYPLQ